MPLASLEELSVSPLPYTLTWTKDHVYVSKSQEILQITRVPLFRQSRAGAQAQGAESHVRENEIFLPSSTTSRPVHYPPPNPASKAKDLATVILGSRSPSFLGRALKSRYETLHPRGLYVDEKTQLGGWKLLEGENSKETKKKASLGGRLQGKFEKFDRTDDCDIVLYLF